LISEGEEDADSTGPLSARGREGGVPLRSEGLGGPWAASAAGPKFIPGALLLIFYVLSFSLFCFSDLFISFAFLLQNDSNQIVNFPKNEQNILE
jgi:hypothetical protein